MKLSVLDLVPVRSDQATPDAIAASLKLAELADQLGFTRFWVAEHHNMPAVAATTPPVLIGLVASRTKDLIVGSGGVMLPNHAPLAVAEQFAVLEAAFPGRIDLGIGRAPGSDPVTSWALRNGDDQAVLKFDQYVDDTLALMSPEGVRVAIPRQNYVLRATPAAGSTPTVWLLGSSDYSARLAAAKGLPYVFAHHFSGQGTVEALDIYRSQFVPSEQLDKPQTLVTVNAVVADDEQEAKELAIPNLQLMARLRSGKSLHAIDLVEDALALELEPHLEHIVQSGLRRPVIGTVDQAVEQIRALAQEFDVDEVMINPVASARRGVDPQSSPGRDRTLELLASRLI